MSTTVGRTSATGDVNNNFEKMKSELKSIRFDVAGTHFNVAGLLTGDPIAYLPIFNYILNEFSRPLAKYLAAKGHGLITPKPDQKWMEAAYRTLNDEFNIRPDINLKQFFTTGFAEKKMILVCDIIRACKRKHNELCKQRQEQKARQMAMGDVHGGSLTADTIRRSEDDRSSNDNEYANIERSKHRKSLQVTDDNMRNGGDGVVDYHHVSSSALTGSKTQRSHSAPRTRPATVIRHAPPTTSNLDIHVNNINEHAHHHRPERSREQPPVQPSITASTSGYSDTNGSEGRRGIIVSSQRKIIHNEQMQEPDQDILKYYKEQQPQRDTVSDIMTKSYRAEFDKIYALIDSRISAIEKKFDTRMDDITSRIILLEGKVKFLENHQQQQQQRQMEQSEHSISTQHQQQPAPTSATLLPGKGYSPYSSQYLANGPTATATTATISRVNNGGTNTTTPGLDDAAWATKTGKRVTIDTSSIRDPSPMRGATPATTTTTSSNASSILSRLPTSSAYTTAGLDVPTRSATSSGYQPTTESSTSPYKYAPSSSYLQPSAAPLPSSTTTTTTTTPYGAVGSGASSLLSSDHIAPSMSSIRKTSQDALSDLNARLRQTKEMLESSSRRNPSSGNLQ